VRIVVAMSGGVDSSVAAALLHEQGHDVIGVHMKLHDVAATASNPGHCCGLDDAMDARKVASDKGFPFYVMDLREAFRKAVMDHFASEYRAGRTPNPCVQCNGVLKFRILLQRAKALGASHLATGHYARVAEDGTTLRVAHDPDKDQSYFLFPLSREALACTIFPLGELTKAEVRHHARRLRLDVADKPESQEVCFIPDDDHARFVRDQDPSFESGGDIVDEEGHVLGQHGGYFRYTVGQRRGLGIAAGAPLYVLRVEAATRRVVVGPGARLEETALVASGLHWFRKPAEGEEVLARIRHRGALIPCLVEGTDPATIRFKVPARAVAPGQAIVLYRGDHVLGGGWIERRVDDRM
jgi:tRNA-uridine 2-sulfurtransferase